MARLNEPPPAVESVEALKRRFIRQNREIARTNSVQSLRIRNLEAETSRMLSENITLREENIQLKRELEKGQSQYALQNVTGVRGQLEQKLEELGLLVSKLKEAETMRPPRSPSRRRTSRKSFKQSPIVRDHRDPFEFTNLDAAEGRLPPILEDKCFPRLSLNAEGLQSMVSGSNEIVESPELGPPPVAHFEEGDPVKHDTTEVETLAQSPSKLLLDGDEDGDATTRLFANLETRRRRRESSSGKGHEQASLLGPLDDKSQREGVQEPMKQPLKAGAKRKLGVRDDGDERNTASRLQQKDEFSFNRRNEGPKGIEKTTIQRKHDQEFGGNTTTKERSRQQTSSVQGSRTALGEKSVNTDPVTSPAKSKQLANGKPSELKKSNARIPRERDQTKDRKVPVRTIEPRVAITEPKVVSIEPQDLPPITPAPPDLDLFSPEPSNPPTAGTESRDTPPPADLGTGAAGRTSRRRGANISYAEPNLRDKMRRPGKELVDAITDVKFVRASSQKADGSKSEGEETHEVPIKQEEVADHESWNPTFQPKEPTSPLGARSTDTAAATSKPLTTTTLTERRQRPVSSYRSNEDATGLSNNTIAALVAGGQRRMSRAREIAAGRTEPVNDSKRDSMSVFDFGASSPEMTTEQAKRAAKRTASNQEPRRGSKQSQSESEPTNGFTGVAARAPRRRDTLATASKADPEVPPVIDFEENDGKGSLRAERAERRRSMMV